MGYVWILMIQIKKGILKNQNSFFDLNHQNPYIAQISPAPALPLKNKIKSPILNYVSF